MTEGAVDGLAEVEQSSEESELFPKEAKINSFISSLVKGLRNPV